MGRKRWRTVRIKKPYFYCNSYLYFVLFCNKKWNRTKNLWNNLQRERKRENRISTHSSLLTIVILLSLHVDLERITWLKSWRWQTQVFVPSSIYKLWNVILKFFRRFHLSIFSFWKMKDGNWTMKSSFQFSLLPFLITLWIEKFLDVNFPSSQLSQYRRRSEKVLLVY